MLFLEDIELIKQLKHRYWRCIDTAAIDELRECFIENASYSFIGGSYQVVFEGREKFLEFMRQVNSGDFISSHVGSHPEITVLTATTAAGVWNMLDNSWDLRRMVLTRGQAVCSDRYVKVEDGWKISHTGYSRIYEVVEEIKERPKLTAHYLRTVGPQRLEPLPASSK
jgi:SnoaL-like domain